MEKPKRCVFCDFETEDLEYYDFNDVWLCEPCSHMPTNGQRDQRVLDILIGISYCTNLILKEIRNIKNN